MSIKLEVRSKSPNGFRRAGRYWGPEPVEVELEGELANQVMHERQLLVRRMDGQPIPSRDAARPPSKAVTAAPTPAGGEQPPTGEAEEHRRRR